MEENTLFGKKILVDGKLELEIIYEILLAIPFIFFAMIVCSIPTIKAGIAIAVIILLFFLYIVVMLVEKYLMGNSRFVIAEDFIFLNIRKWFGLHKACFRYDKLIDVHYTKILGAKFIQIVYTSGRNEGVFHNKSVRVLHLIDAEKICDFLSNKIAIFGNVLMDTIKADSSQEVENELIDINTQNDNFGIKDKEHISPVVAKIETPTTTQKEETNNILEYDHYINSYGVYCTNNDVEQIKIPATHKGQPVTHVVAYAFGGGNVERVSLGNNIVKICENAFNGCMRLTNVEIPNSVKEIGGSAFADCCHLTQIQYNGTVSEWQAIKKDYYWKDNVPSTCIIHCIDGDINI